MLVNSVSLDVRIDYFGLSVQDHNAAALPAAYPAGRDPRTEGFLTALPGRIDLKSAGHTHTAAMTVEIHDQRPSLPEGEWDEVEETAIALSSRRVVIWSVTSGPSGEAIEVGEPGTWDARVSCSGRPETARREPVEGPTGGTERYVVQLWPAPRSADAAS